MSPFSKMMSPTFTPMRNSIRRSSVRFCATARSVLGIVGLLAALLLLLLIGLN
jgi:hypothetical protein